METKYPHLYEASEMISSMSMVENQRMTFWLTMGQKQQAYTIQFRGEGWKAGEYVDVLNNQCYMESS